MPNADRRFYLTSNEELINAPSRAIHLNMIVRLYYVDKITGSIDFKTQTKKMQIT
jgi:hypothetical protein